MMMEPVSIIAIRISIHAWEIHRSRIEYLRDARAMPQKLLPGYASMTQGTRAYRKSKCIRTNVSLWGVTRHSFLHCTDECKSAGA